MVHKSAIVSKSTKIGKNVKVWHFAVIREGAEIGDNCIIGKSVYVDQNVKIGSNVKIQNNSLVYEGTTIEDDVFIGPAVCFSNDKYPRSTISGKLKDKNDWDRGTITVKNGASIGASSVIVTGVRIGQYAMIGAGSVVTKSVPAHGLFFGNPARLKGYVCPEGHTLKKINRKSANNYFCPACKVNITIANEK